MKTIHKVKIRGNHIDVFGHVNNLRYLEFMDEAKWQHLEQNGDLFTAFKNLGIGHATVNININYKTPAYFGQILTIETYLSGRGSKSVSVQQDIYADGMLVADAQTTNVLIDASTGRAVEIDDKVLKVWTDLAELPAQSN
jgi:thioesterase-3